MKLPGHSPACRCGHCHNGQGSPLFSLSDISYSRERRPILVDINLTVDIGDFIAITGPNGGGKTTLLRLILGLAAPNSGNISFYASDGSRIQRPRIGYLPQKSAVDSHFPITVGEVVASGLLGTKTALAKSRKKEIVEQELLRVGLEDLADRAIGKLSGGQLQRALLARAIVSRPAVLALDEPLSYLDSVSEDRFYTILESLRGNTTILLVTHQMSRVAAMANRHVIVDHTLRECTATVHYRPED